METHVNDNVLSKSDNEGSRDIGRWKLPMKEGGKLGDVKLTNPEVQKFIVNMKSIIDICLSQYPDDYMMLWHTVIHQLICIRILLQNFFLTTSLSGRMCALIKTSLIVLWIYITSSAAGME